MTTDEDAGRRPELEAFRKNYAERLPSRIDAIGSDWQLACLSQSPEDFRSLRRVLHNLHGSAATCGFASVSDEARNLEEIVAAILDGGRSPSDLEKSEFSRHYEELVRARCDVAPARSESPEAAGAEEHRQLRLPGW